MRGPVPIKATVPAKKLRAVVPAPAIVSVPPAGPRVKANPKLASASQDREPLFRTKLVELPS